MITASHPNIKRRPATWLCLPALLIGVSVAPAARSASLMAPPALVAAIDLTFILEAPPPPRHEEMVERDRPSRDHVWVAGYWANRHGKHEWVAGHWEVPPRGRTVWVEPRWEKRDRGYVFIEGSWAAPHQDDHHERH
jgi:hypothetical protein